MLKKKNTQKTKNKNRLAFISICEIALPHRPPQAPRKLVTWIFIALQTAKS